MKVYVLVFCSVSYYFDFIINVFWNRPDLCELLHAEYYSCMLFIRPIPEVINVLIVYL